MNCFELKEKEYLFEHVPNTLDNENAVKTLFDYLEHEDKPILKHITGKFMNDLLINYIELKKYNPEYKKTLEQCMQKYDFNYYMAIHNAIYYMLAKKSELEKNKMTHIKPTDWPGVNSYSNNGSTYTINTIHGNITVNKANELFKDTKSSFIFNKDLMGRCYNRTYEFAKMNHDYTIVLSYMPNFFCNGHFHTYLERGNETLDIASNGLYTSSEESSKILNGEIIKKMSVEEADDSYNQVTKELGNHQLVKEFTKLHLLSLYYKK